MLIETINCGVLDINCCDPLGRSALLMAIDNENLEMVDLLLDNKVTVLHQSFTTLLGNSFASLIYRDEKWFSNSFEGGIGDFVKI